MNSALRKLNIIQLVFKSTLVIIWGYDRDSAVYGIKS